MQQPELERLPYFKLYPADYLLDTIGLSVQEHGIYCLLIFNYYFAGCLPDALADIYRICFAVDHSVQATVDLILKKYFHHEDGRYLHFRIERELDKLSGFRRKQSEKGKLSAAARAKTPVKRKSAAKDGNGVDTGFPDFWSIYQCKKAKKKALDEWTKLHPDAALQARIMAAVKAQNASQQWQRDNGKYIPYPATWLHGRRWEDEAPKQQERTLAI